MSITDELRAWAKEHLSRSSILAIADRIDAEHEREMMEIRNRGWNNGYDEGFASADDWLEQNESDMAEHGWVRLPLDADNVPIHAGDVLDGYGKTIEVVELRHGRSGWVLISRDGNGYADTFAFTHHHAPTVEDVLREFALKVAGEECMTMRTGVVEEYAAKLRLAKEEDA